MSELPVGWDTNTRHSKTPTSYAAVNIVRQKVPQQLKPQQSDGNKEKKPVDSLSVKATANVPYGFGDPSRHSKTPTSYAAIATSWGAKLDQEPSRTQLRPAENISSKIAMETQAAENKLLKMRKKQDSNVGAIQTTDGRPAATSNKMHPQATRVHQSSNDSRITERLDNLEKHVAAIALGIARLEDAKSGIQSFHSPAWSHLSFFVGGAAVASLAIMLSSRH
jgi:hypothetical protein